MHIKEESRLNRIIGKEIPDFHLKAVSGDGEDFIDVSLDTYKGHWLVLFFHPMDSAFVCPTELISFSNGLRLFEDADTRLLAVSTDSEYTHQAWIGNGLGRIGYPLGADKTLSVSAGYGVLLEDQGVALRGLFIIGPDQIVHYSIIHDNNTGRSTQEVLRVLGVLQTGSLYGANQTIGSQPLRGDSNALPDVFSTDQTVRTYTLPDCSYCRQIKEFLSGNGISSEGINLENDAKGRAFMDSQGYTALPVTVIGSNEISGFHLGKTKELLL